MLTSITFHGKIGKLFGRDRSLDVETPAEALNVLIRFIPGLGQFFIDSEKKGVAYRVLVDGKEVSFHERLVAKFNKSLDIYPVVIGSKRAGTFQTILGIVIIAAAVIYSGGTAAGAAQGAWSAAFSGAAGGFVQFAAFMGTSMFLGGLSQLIANPAAPSFDSSSDNKRSYLFSGAAQTARQGSALPLGYGRAFIGPVIVSAGIFAEQLALAQTTGVDTDGDGILDDFNGDGIPDEARV